MLITDLPIEIHCQIFSEIYWKERRNISDEEARSIKVLISDGKLPISYDQETRWRDDDLQAVPNLFPHTTASVCRLWQNILFSTPEYWTRFVLDLDSPACLPFEVFNWSQAELLNVVILSHPQETSDDSKKLENERVLSVFKALTPYIPSCKSIVFDVKYASSLPSPSPFLLNKNGHLKTLIMDSEIDDVALPTSLDMPPKTTIGQEIFNINRLDLHGAAYMELSRIHFTSYQWAHSSLTLSHLECAWSNGSCCTMNELLEFLFLAGNISDITFKRARFVDGQTPQAPDEKIDPLDLLFQLPDSLTFEDADPNFISVFASYTYDSLIVSLTFKNCILPRLHTFWNSHLSLIDIPDTQSLKNIIFHHGGTQITFTSCPGFSDNFLDWFAMNRCSPMLHSLNINSCDKFTFAGLRAFLEMRDLNRVDKIVPETCKEGVGGGNDSGEDSDESYIGYGSEDGDGETIWTAYGRTPDDSWFFDNWTRGYRKVRPLERVTVRSSGFGLTDDDRLWLKEYCDGGYGPFTWVEGHECFDFHRPLPSPPRASLNSFVFHVMTGMI